MLIKFKDFIIENNYINRALDKINKVGGFDNLPDIDKLALLSDSGREEQLKKLNLRDIYKENGGTFGRFNIKVKVKPISEQPVKHNFSKESEDKIGWINSYIHYSDNNEPYVIVRFDDFNKDSNMKGGGIYDEKPIMLDNIYPIGYGDIRSEFVDYDNKVEFDRKEFLNRMNDILGNNDD